MISNGMNQCEVSLLIDIDLATCCGGTCCVSLALGFNWRSRISWTVTSMMQSCKWVCLMHAACFQIDALERTLTSSYISLLGFCHNDLQYGNMLLHTTAHRSLSFNSLRSHSIERAVRGGSPPPRAGSIRGSSPPPRGGSPFLNRSASPLDLEG